MRFSLSFDGQDDDGEGHEHEQGEKRQYGLVGS
jgi:hypothetical protein